MRKTSKRAIQKRIFAVATIAGLVILKVTPVIAGPPYQTDDPETTPYQHFEIYAFNEGSRSGSGFSGESGIDFNYGATPDLQLTATLPIGFNFPLHGKTAISPSNIELAMKYRFLHQDTFGFDVSVFPRAFLPSGSHAIGDDHASFLLPVWVQKDWDKWSAFGGGGCQISAAGQSHDFCIYGGTLTRQVLPRMQLGIEVFHQTADGAGDLPTTSLGAGAEYDLNENIHLLGYAAKGVQNARAADQYSWYTSVLFTF